MHWQKNSKRLLTSQSQGALHPYEDMIRHGGCKNMELNQLELTLMTRSKFHHMPSADAIGQIWLLKKVEELLELQNVVSVEL